MKYDHKLLTDAHAWASYHRVLVSASRNVGCFYCLAVYPASELPMNDEQVDSGAQSRRGWTDRHNHRTGEEFEAGQTALCVKCGTDSVLPDAAPIPATDHEFLCAMRKRWFGSEDA